MLFAVLPIYLLKNVKKKGVFEMTKAIDMRVRPPYKKMREASILRHIATEGHRRDIELYTSMHCCVAAASYLHDNAYIKILTFFVPWKQSFIINIGGNRRYPLPCFHINGVAGTMLHHTVKISFRIFR